MKAVDVPLERFRKARFWLNDAPAIDKNVVQSHMRRLRSGECDTVESRRVVVEISVPVGFTMYGLLGGRIEPLEDGFELEIRSGEGVAFSQALVSADLDEVRTGLADEYVAAVVESLEECVAHRIDSLPQARITIDIAACGAVGSNEIVFRKLSKVLFESLISTPIPTRDSMQKLIDKVF